MEALSDVLSSKKWDLPTQQPTFAIGLSFIFLAYFLHPRIESAYQRVRASRAWRAVQKHKRVDVTDYPMLSEAFGVRGKWDAARTVTVLLAAFSLGSWVLELSLEIYHVKGEAYLLTQPPPVYKYFQDPENQNLTWQVLPLEDINPHYDGEWRNLDNMKDNLAKSMYYVKGYRRYAWSKKIDTYVDGEIVVANWDPDNKPGLSYGGADTVTVENITCTGPGDPLVDASVHHNSGEWGRVLECGEGPIKVDAETVASQPAIILADATTGEVHVVVEEVGAHPSFLYSVWTAKNASSVDLAYTFHISSTVRLAEAVVTGIVHGETDGGSCFGLLRAFSRGDDTEDTSASYPAERFQRAKPFGEKPEDGTVKSLQDVETLEAGVLMNTNALVAFVCLLLLSLVGIGWSMCLKSSVEMDVYDRDELLRAISQQAQGEENDPSKREKMRIYVQKEHGGELNVVISESDDDHNGCVRFLLRREPTPSIHPVPVADTVSHALDDHGGAALPLGRPRMYLGGIRTGMGRVYPGRNNNFRYPVSVATSVALSASPVPSTLPTPVNSNVGSAAGTPAPRGRARRRLGRPGVYVGSPIPSVAGSSAATTPAPLNPGSAVGTPRPSDAGSAAGTPVAPLRSPRPPGFLPSLGGLARSGRGWGGGGGGGGVGDFGVADRGASVLFESFNTFGDNDRGGGGSSSSSSSSGGGGETDGDGSASGSADIEMSRGIFARSHVSAFGGGGAGGDIEMGNLELVRPQTPAFPGDQGRPNARGGGAGAQAGTGTAVESQRDKNDDGGVEEQGDDALHLPSDRTTPPASPETASPGSSPPPPPPPRGLTTEQTLGRPQLGSLTLTGGTDPGQGGMTRRERFAANLESFRRAVGLAESGGASGAGAESGMI